MIGYIQGKIIESSEDGNILVGVGGTSGSIGYSLSVPRLPELILRLQKGSMAEFYVFTYVREDSIDLYGFASSEEKEFFQMLIQVNGIGPKAALNLLSSAPVGELAHAILNGDKAFLSRVHGVGKKTSDRLIVELPEKIKKKMEEGKFSAPASLKTANLKRSAASANGGKGLFIEAQDALLGLGYREAEVSNLLRQIMAEQGEGVQRTEDLVKSALRSLAAMG